jgi:hypothetical protein
LGQTKRTRNGWPVNPEGKASTATKNKAIESHFVLEDHEFLYDQTFPPTAKNDVPESVTVGVVPTSFRVAN